MWLLHKPCVYAVEVACGSHMPNMQEWSKSGINPYCRDALQLDCAATTVNQFGDRLCPLRNKQIDSDIRYADRDHALKHADTCPASRRATTKAWHINLPTCKHSAAMRITIIIGDTLYHLLTRVILAG